MSVEGETEQENVLQTTNRNNYAQQSPKITAAYNGRRKSSLSYQQQLQVAAAGINGGKSESCASTSPSSYCQSPKEVFIHSHHQSTKLSLQPMDRYEDVMNSCLPPPSPAPTSDRFVMVMPAPSLATSTGSNGSYTRFSNFESEPATPAKQSSAQSLITSPSSASASASASFGKGTGNIQPLQPSICSAAASTAGLVLSQKFSSTNSSLQRSLSPNSRFRLSDRFRESPSCSSGSSSRFVPSTHFLSQNSPAVSGDAYTYLSSAVHTPVKRYVPTPPPPIELYADMALPLQQQRLLPAGASKSSSTHQQLPPPAHLQPNQRSANGANTLPYRLRMKCCSNEPAQVQGTQHDPRPENVADVDYYATSPRISYKCTSSGNVNTIAPHNCSNKDGLAVSLSNAMKPCTPSPISSSSSSSTSGLLAPTSSTVYSTISGGVGAACSHQEKNLRASKNCASNDFVSQTPSIEYVNASLSNNTAEVTGRIMSPVSVFSSLDGVSSGAAGGCLHCSSMRRTTGVHQTTQTTGPISPIPLQQLTSNAIYSNSAHKNIELTSSTPTPSTSHSHSSSLSPLMTLQQKKHQLQKNEQEKVGMEQRNESFQQQPHLYQLQRPQQQKPLVSTHNLLERNNVISSQQQQQPQPQHYHQQSAQQPPQSHQSLPTQQLQLQQHYSRKQRISQYVRKGIAKFFGVDEQSEPEERAKWCGRQRRLALRRFGMLRPEREIGNDSDVGPGYHNHSGGVAHSHRRVYSSTNHQHTSDRPDILPAEDAESSDMQIGGCKNGSSRRRHYINTDFRLDDHVERKASVPSMFVSGFTYIVQRLSKRQTRRRHQWSRSFAPAHIKIVNGGANPSDICEGLTTLQEEEVFFDSPGNEQNNICGMASTTSSNSISPASGARSSAVNAKIIEHQRQLYMGERAHGWRTSTIISSSHVSEPLAGPLQPQQQILAAVQPNQLQQPHQQPNGMRGNRIASQILDGVLENSRRPQPKRVKLYSIKDLDDRHDHRPFFTYWINTVQILVLFLSLICYGIGPIGFGVEQKTGQVLVTSLSLQTVQHHEQRNVWIGPRNSDLVHMGAKFATCMRRDIKIMEVLGKTRRKERETACCIRNDDSGCVQSSQADCSVRGLFPTKSISTWKKWSPGESGPGGRISGSVCGLDPKYCDAPASIAPYEWPDDITKWPICRKTNSFSQRFRYKDHTAEHMVCEVIGHPCCTGVFGECRITTREYCDFVNGYFHEEASLCSQISCLKNVCGMFPFFSIEVPDQFYRLFTSLCLHAGILHLAITVAFQHVFLADLERLIGPFRTAIVYIGSGLAGNLTSAVLVPYKPEVGPLASLSGVVASLVALLILMHWKQLYEPHVALLKLVLVGCLLFGIGTLPWQLNFAGLLAGIFCGIFLTIALVPFVAVSKYGRKAKINLVWSCILFHLFIYTAMLVVFYVFPSELANLNFSEVLTGGTNSDVGSFGGIDRFSNNVMTSSTNRNQQQEQKQYHHHHHSDDIISKSAFNDEELTAAQIYFNHNYRGIRAGSSKNIANMLFYEGGPRIYNVNNNNSSNRSSSNYRSHVSEESGSSNTTNVGSFNSNVSNSLLKSNYNIVNGKVYRNINGINKINHSGKPCLGSAVSNILNSNAPLPQQQHIANAIDFNGLSSGIQGQENKKQGDDTQPSTTAIRNQDSYLVAKPELSKLSPLLPTTQNSRSNRGFLFVPYSTNGKNRS